MFTTAGVCLQEAAVINTLLTLCQDASIFIHIHQTGTRLHILYTYTLELQLVNICRLIKMMNRLIRLWITWLLTGSYSAFKHRLRLFQAKNMSLSLKKICVMTFLHAKVPRPPHYVLFTCASQSLMCACQRYEGTEMSHSLATSILTSGGTMFSSAPHCEKHTKWCNQLIIR